MKLILLSQIDRLGEEADSRPEHLWLWQAGKPFPEPVTD